MSIGGCVIAVVQKSKMAAAMLDFIFVQYIQNLKRNTPAKFRAIMCNNKRVMNNK